MLAPQKARWRRKVTATRTGSKSGPGHGSTALTINTRRPHTNAGLKTRHYEGQKRKSPDPIEMDSVFKRGEKRQQGYLALPGRRAGQASPLHIAGLSDGSRTAKSAKDPPVQGAMTAG
jgi:hypothetical protein